MNADGTCGLPTDLPEARAALAGVRTIAVVGLSNKPDRPAYRIAEYLLEHGFEVIPIHPQAQVVLGQPVHPSLTAYGRPVDLVNIFRRAEAVPGIVDEALALGCKVIWMQEGITHAEAAARAQAAGVKVVENRCIMRVHRALIDHG